MSIEGISGAGKTYLARRLLEVDPALAAETVAIEEFSRRPGHGDLGHDLLNGLKGAAAGDPLLRGGQPAAETLLLLAIKAHDYEEHCVPALRQGRIVLEGRSLHCVAVYQSLILHPGHRHIHHRAAALYDRMAVHAPGNIVVLDRRQLGGEEDAVSLLRGRIVGFLPARAVP